MRSLLLFLYLFLALKEGAGESDPVMPFMVYLDPDNLVSLNWGFDSLQRIITFKLAINTTGWVSIGLSPNGGMKGSDIVIGGFGPSGSYLKVSHHHIHNTSNECSSEFPLCTEYNFSCLEANKNNFIFLLLKIFWFWSIRTITQQGTPCLWWIHIRATLSCLCLKAKVKPSWLFRGPFRHVTTKTSKLPWDIFFYSVLTTFCTYSMGVDANKQWRWF